MLQLRLKGAPGRLCRFCRLLPLMVTMLAASPVLQARQASAVFDASRARLQDAETVKALTDEGRVLLQKDRIRLDGFQYCGQAVALAERGQFRESIQAASKALLLGQQQGQAELVASAKRDLAITYSYAGDFERAEQYANEALQGDADSVAIVAAPALKTLGDVAVRRARHADAVAFYTRAAAVASPRYRPLVQISLANALLQDQQIDAARAAFAQVGELEPSMQLALKRGLANLRLAEKNYPDALRLFRQVADGAAGSDAAYHRLWGQDGVGRTLLLMGQRDGARLAMLDAVRTSEQVRSRFRSEEFKAGLFGDVQQVFDRAIALTAEAGDAEGAWALSEQSRSRALLDIVRDRVERAGGGAGGFDGSAPLSAAAARARLRAGEAMVAYHTLDDAVLAWVVRADGVRGARIEIARPALASQVDGFRQAIFNRKSSARELGLALHTLLIAPLELRAGEQLLIIPHDSLHYLPFQALRDHSAYLIERHALAFAPSAGVALRLAARSSAARQADGALVAFGNPGTDAAYALPDAEKEVKLIGQLFPDNRVFVQAAASTRQFRAQAGTARILHVAAHAEVDVIDPLQSRILLAPEGADSGFMTARDVYGLDLDRVALVTLSACESGLGRIARGDEIMGFTRSFLSAGASSLLVSLWPVADDSTQLLMTTLYGALAKGETAGAAMQAAQLAVMRRPRFAHPFFWAPFDLVGDWRLTIAPSRGAQL